MKSTTRVLCISTSAPNPIIRILAHGIASESFLVDTDVQCFWERKQRYDIIQIHFPEIFFYSTNNRLPTKEFGAYMSETLQYWEKSGSKIVFTKYDETTHYVKSRDVRTYLFDVIEKEADAIVHPGYFTKNRIVKEQSASNQLHVVIPQIIFDTYYQCSISQAEARQALGIDEKYRVVLAFGTFRHEEENLLVKKAFEQLDDPDKYLFAPAWFHDGWHEYMNTQITVDGNCRLGKGVVDRDMLPYCFAASDVVFIQRIRNLNSGNIQMGFFFNKTVVGPAIGNITELLDNVNNFSFDPFDPLSVLKALEKGLERSRFRQVNEAYAREHWNTSKICGQYQQLYQQLTSC